GYKFVKWEKLVGDDQYEDFSTESQINVTVENNLTITAVFEKEETEVPTTPDTPAITKVNPTLQLKAVVKNNAKKQTSIATLSWKAVKGASYYEVYGKFADSEEYSLLTTIKTKTCKISLEFGNAYAAKIKAVAANGYVLEESLEVYFVAGNTDESNAKSIISANVKVGMGRTTQIASAILPTEKGKTVFGEKYVNLYRYYSSDTSIAEVDDYGTVTAKAVGKVTIFLYAPNGVMKKITVNVVSNMLMLKATVKNSSNATISWNNVAGATAYDVYLAQYGIALEKVATFDSNVKMCNIAQLEAEKEYACIVHALDANGNIIAESNFVHFVASSSAKTNAKKVTASSVSITVNGTAMIIATVAPAEKNKTAITDFTYFSLQPNVATVDKNGIVTGLAKGKATIYVFAANGVYKTIKVTVK
ncbi:MAG: Ig-like domain-containing protein, partial [Clostridia bacterium]|nr:Ig-like domain-containing protein [Clostridia bacterium]